MLIWDNSTQLPTRYGQVNFTLLIWLCLGVGVWVPLLAEAYCRPANMLCSPVWDWTGEVLQFKSSPVKKKVRHFGNKILVRHYFTLGKKIICSQNGNFHWQSLKSASAVGLFFFFPTLFHLTTFLHCKFTQNCFCNIKISYCVCQLLTNLNISMQISFRCSDVILEMT